MATQVVNGTINFTADFAESFSTGLITAFSLPARITRSLTYTNATTGALTVDQIHAKVYTLAAAVTHIDLTSLLDLNGNTMNLARVREFVCYNADPVATHLVNVYRTSVAASSASAWTVAPLATGPNTVQANGGVVGLSDPNSLTTTGMVVGASSKYVTFDPGAFTVNLSVLIVGGTAA